jgi:hypothetical protein
LGGAAAPGSAAAFRMITAAPCRELSLVCFVDFGLPGGATARPLGAGCLLAAMPLRDSSCPVGAVPPCGWGVPLAGEIAFSFVGKRDVFTLQLVFCLPGRGCLSACPAGAKTAFSFDSKEKAVLDSEKEKVDQWKSWGGAVQQDRLPVLRCCSSGKILWDILLFPAACV